MEDTITGIYCERLGPGLLAEPFNAVSNGSFLIAAWAAWSLARGTGGLSAGLRVLIALAASVAIGSGLWHTLATPWAMILDVVPIALFLIWTLWLYARTVLDEQLQRITASTDTALGIGAIVALLIALWSASKGVKSLMSALDIAYHERERRYSVSNHNSHGVTPVGSLSPYLAARFRRSFFAAPRNRNRQAIRLQDIVPERNRRSVKVPSSRLGRVPQSFLPCPGNAHRGQDEADLRIGLRKIAPKLPRFRVDIL